MKSCPLVSEFWPTKSTQANCHNMSNSSKTKTYLSLFWKLGSVIVEPA